MPTTVSARFVRTARWLAVTCTLVALGHVAAQCVDVPALGSDRSVEVGDVTCVASRLASDGRHTVAFDLRVATPGHVHDLVLHAPGATALEVCVQVAGEWSCHGADADGVRFVDLLLPEGTVGVRASLRGDVGQAFRVEFEDRGAPQPGFAYEPNDHVATATLLGDDLTIRGRFQGRNIDVVRVEIEGDPQLWRVQVLGPTVDQLNLLAASGRAQQTRSPAAGDRGVRMSNLYLLPGPHYLSVRGTDGEYALRLIPLGPADEPPSEAAPTTPAEGAARSFGTPTAPRQSAAAAAVEVPVPSGPRPAGQMEREPNDDARTASLLRPDEPWVGLLSDPGDVDVYRFYLGEDGPVRLTATPPDGMPLYVRVDGGGRIDLAPGEPFVLERWFLAGDHTIALSAAESVDGYYQVLLERLEPFALGDLPRPHGELWRARALPAYHEIRAVLERTAYVRLPELHAPTVLTVEVVEGAEHVNPFAAYTATGSNVASFRGRRDDGIYVAELPAGGPYLVRVDGGGHAHLRFAFDDAGPAAQPRPEAPAVTLTLHGARDVAAYHPYAQRLELEVEIRNDGAQPLDLALDTHVTDHGWRLTPRETTVSLAAGETRRVGLDATVDPVARDDLPVELTVAVRAADGGVASVMTSATAVCGVPLVGGVHAFAVPEPLLGGINVGWTNLGAEAPSGARRELLLYDGLTQPGDGWPGGVGDHTTVRLAGDGTPRVVGVLLHPLSQFPVLARLGDFEIQTSLDGSSFTTVYRGRLRSPTVEQAFVFDEGVAARYVRLVALSNQDGNPRANTGLGQFKVIAEPGARVLGDRVDLGLREHGGHVAAALPYVASYELTSASRSSGPTTYRLDHGQDTVWWAHAFHHNRAALLDGLVWHPHPGAANARGEHLDEVRVSVSLDSPIGPWTEVGAWRVGETDEWRFDAPLWARFVRFEAHFPEADRPTVVLPDRIGLLEHPEGPEYRSVLGEWGHYVRDGAFEWRHPPSVAAIVSGGEHATRDRAAQLSGGETIGTTVLVGEYDAWFSFEVPAGSNFVRLELLGDPTVDYLYEFTDADGEPIVADVRVAPERIEIEAFLEPGRYFVHAWEPLRNVVFSWDDSGSMGPYVDATMQTVFGFARDVDPAR
ncbi:MAG: discoidin domain-containing protein, partial [Trueperaceae bacterium]